MILKIYDQLTDQNSCMSRLRSAHLLIVNDGPLPLKPRMAMSVHTTVLNDGIAESRNKKGIPIGMPSYFSKYYIHSIQILHNLLQYKVRCFPVSKQFRELNRSAY